MKLNWNFLGIGGLLNKQPSVAGAWSVHSDVYSAISEQNTVYSEKEGELHSFGKVFRPMRTSSLQYAELEFRIARIVLKITPLMAALNEDLGCKSVT